MPVHVRVAASLSHISKTYKTFFFLCQAGEIREEGLRGGKKEWEKGRQVKSCHAIFTDYKKFYSIWTVLSTFFFIKHGAERRREGWWGGRKAGMGWDRELVVRWGGGNWGAGTTLLWQQTDWQKCKQLWCKEREREREREVSAP